MTIRIAIDVDLTLTNDLGIDWWDYLQDKYKQYQSWEDYVRFCTDHNNSCAEYNLTKYFNIPDYEDPYYFWKKRGLYDNRVLVKGSYNVIKKWYEAGYELVFVSHTYAEHIESKFRFLQRNLDFIDNINFVATMDKSIMNGCVDIVIDDRLSNLLEFDDYILKLQYKTPYKQDVEAVDKQIELCENWEQIEEQVDLYKESI